MVKPAQAGFLTVFAIAVPFNTVPSNGQTRGVPWTFVRAGLGHHEGRDGDELVMGAYIEYSLVML